MGPIDKRLGGMSLHRAAIIPRLQGKTLRRSFSRAQVSTSVAPLSRQIPELRCLWLLVPRNEGGLFGGERT